MNVLRRISRVFVGLLWVQLAGCGTQTASGPPRAVFLIVVDTLRPDRLSCYGSPNPTPNFLRLAKQGVLFEAAQSTASWTVPAMGAMMTSRYPTQLGLVEEPAPPNARFLPRERRKQVAYTLPEGPTLATILRDAGFTTTAFVNQPFINMHDGFLQGFDAWCYPLDEAHLTWHDTSQPIPEAQFPPDTELGRADSILVDAFTDWLANREDERMPFAWIHLLSPHWPYRPPARYMENVQGDWRLATNSARYDGEVRAVDDLVGSVLDAIDQHVGLKHSLVILVSDHGEAFGEHDGVEHGHTLHREVIHVPLIISSPGLPRGHAVPDIARTIDLAPTILDLMNVHSRTGSFEGVSLVSAIRGEPKPVIAYSEGMLYGGTERSVTTNGYKLIYEVDGGDRYRLFNIAADPYEMRDIAQQSQLRATDMRLVLEGIHTRLSEDYQNGTTQTTSPEDESVLRSLKALGYIGGD